MKMTEATFKMHCDEYNGYCKKCDDVTNYGHVEPDARGYRCDDCDKPMVMGVEEALMMGFIEFKE